MIKTLDKLYSVFDNLFRGIEKDCDKCEYSHCLGYVWLLSQEADRLIEGGIDVLQVNENLFFINSFTIKKGKIDVEEFKPKCPFLSIGRCAIYSQRPLTCRMYPLSFFLDNDKLQLVLHLDCLHSKHRMTDRAFKERSLAILRQTNKHLLGEITETYRKVFAISKFPQGGNDYVVIGPINFLYSERR